MGSACNCKELQAMQILEWSTRIYMRFNVSAAAEALDS